MVPRSQEPGSGAARGRARRNVAGQGVTNAERAVLPHLDGAYNLARWLIPSVAEAEAVVERGMLKAMDEYRSYRHVDAKACVLRSVHDTAFELRPWGLEGAPDARAAETDADWSALAVLGELGLTPEALITEVKAHSLDAMLAALPLEMRETIVLFELNGATYKEIAAITGIQVATVMSRLWRARCMLIQLATQPGDAEPDAPRE